ncbi:uncharacterized protein LOC107043045 [Diachasma alloeum]|uniref:uncharacterized protein LOC107043045 n=1 Tax=Diachasma alloeum TaxID=454923 RepID=UPI0007381247|nr:uncharacterized protein LOC107043045 [Diachasma alloeum]
MKEEIPIWLKDLDILILLESRLSANTTAPTKFQFAGFVTFRKDRETDIGGGILIFIRQSIAFIINDTKRFLKAIEDQDPALFIHNTETLTHVDPRDNRRKSKIDLIISTIDVADRLTYNIGDELCGSDHYPLRLTISVEKNYHRKKTFKIYTKSTEWDKVHEELETSYETFLSREFDISSPVEQYNTFVNTVKEAIRKHTPKRREQKPKNPETTNKRQKEQDNPCKWWDNECSKAKRLRRAAERKWEYSNSEADRIKYNRASAQAKKLFKKKKRQHFQEFAQSLDSRSNGSFVWNTSKILKNKWVKLSHNKVTDNLQWRNNIDKAINKISPAHAWTDLTVILKKLPVKYHLILLDIFNNLYRAEEYPEDWIHHFIHFIPKTGGSDVRPIALAPCLAELFGSLLKIRLDWWLEHHDKITNSQTGFRKGVSCHNNLVNLSFGQ